MIGPLNTSNPIDRIQRGGNKVVVSSTGVSVTGLITAVTGQIAFPSSQNASTGANTLDEYEEGTWTPVISGTVTAGTQTYSTNTGKYTRVGRLVTVEFTITMTAADALTAGYLQVSGLTFAPAATIGGAAVAGFANINLDAGYTQLGMIPYSGGLYWYQSGDNVAVGAVGAAALAATTAIYGACSYEV